MKRVQKAVAPKTEEEISFACDGWSAEYQEKYDQALRDLDELESLESRLRRQLALDPGANAVIAREIDDEVADLRTRIARIKRDCGFVVATGKVADSPGYGVVPSKVESQQARCLRLLEWFEAEEQFQTRGALARVTAKDGRRRQTVQADIERGREFRRAANSPLAAMARHIKR